MKGKHELILPELSRKLTARSLRTEKDIVNKAKEIKEEILCGVYFLVKGDSVVYVGQSTNVYSRVKSHEGFKNFDSWCFIQCERKMLDVLESLYIHFLQPKDNGRMGATGQKSTPLTIDELFSRITLKVAP